MTLAEVIDDHFLRRYRELLDDEDGAFDDLEHAYEEGDRARFNLDMTAWKDAIVARLAYLERLGITLDDTVAPSTS